MLKTKIVSLALAGLMTIGGTGITAFAAEPAESVDTTPVSIMAMADKTLTAPNISFSKETKRAELDEKALSLGNAKSAMKEKLLASGKTEDEIAAMKEKMADKFAELKEKKGANRGSKLAAAAEKGIVKGSKHIDDTI